MSEPGPVILRKKKRQRLKPQSRAARARAGFAQGSGQVIPAKAEKAMERYRSDKEFIAVPQDGFKKKVSKVSVDQVIDPDPEDFNPNLGTAFEHMRFLGQQGPIIERTVTEEMLQEILAVLRDGGSQADASLIVGISAGTLTKLQDKYYDFRLACDAAKAMGKLDCVRAIKHGDANWQARAWLLARQYRKEYGEGEGDEQEKRIIKVRPVVGAAPNDPQALPPAAPNVPALPGTTNHTNGVDAIIDKDGSEIPVRG